MLGRYHSTNPEKWTTLQSPPKSPELYFKEQNMTLLLFGERTCPHFWVWEEHYIDTLSRNKLSMWKCFQSFWRCLTQTALVVALVPASSVKKDGSRFQMLRCFAKVGLSDKNMTHDKQKNKQNCKTSPSVWSELLEIDWHSSAIGHCRAQACHRPWAPTSLPRGRIPHWRCWWSCPCSLRGRCTLCELC